MHRNNLIVKHTIKSRYNDFSKFFNVKWYLYRYNIHFVTKTNYFIRLYSDLFQEHTYI